MEPPGLEPGSTEFQSVALPIELWFLGCLAEIRTQVSRARTYCDCPATLRGYGGPVQIRTGVLWAKTTDDCPLHYRPILLANSVQ